MMELKSKAQQGEMVDMKPLYAEHLAKIDTSKDGEVSLEEYIVADADWLTKADTNGDGKCSAVEWMAFRDINHAKDANDDTFTEENFPKLDKDGDGHLTPMEYHKGMMQMAADLMAQGYGRL